MTAHKPLRAPKIAPVTLPELAAASGEDLAAHRRTELIELRDVDLSGRDLSGLDLADSWLLDVVMHQTVLRNASIVDTVIERLDAPVLTGPGSTFRDVEVTGSRIASAELYDASWRSVRFTGCKLGYLNLRGAEIHDLLFADCTIDELDISGAKLTRVAFETTQLNTLEAHRATLVDVDLRNVTIRRITGIEGLRGATMSPTQVADLAETLAGMIGIRTLV